MSGDRDEAEPQLRRLLLSAVPDLPAPEDRLGRVGDIVRWRRRRRAALVGAGAASLVLIVAAALLLQSPAAPPGPGIATQPVPSASSDPAPSASPTPRPTRPTATGSTATPRPPGVAYLSARIPAGSPGTGQPQLTRTGALPSANGVGAFRQVCQYSHMAPEDPILFPDKALSSPLMVFAGNTGTRAGSTAASIAGSGNSTCWGGTADRSAYWTNALIDTRTGTPLAPTEFSIRYSAYSAPPGQVQSMPAGLRLVADLATWGCWDGTTTTYTRPTACPRHAELVLNVWFPRCWTGTTVNSTAVVYPVDQTCPADHPVVLPQLEYHVLYTAPADGNLSSWRLSNDPSAHGAPVVGYGGFIEGWQPAIRQTWTDDCIRAAATCESHVIGDGRVINGAGTL